MARASAFGRWRFIAGRCPAPFKLCAGAAGPGAPAFAYRRCFQVVGTGAAGATEIRAKLVSREGDVWRWDGFTSAADAPSAAAKRLAERNRLSLLEIEMQEAGRNAAEAGQKFEAAKQSVEAGARAEREKREAWRAATSSVEVARQALAKHERQIAERLAQTSALDEAHPPHRPNRLRKCAAVLQRRRPNSRPFRYWKGLTQEVASLRDNVNRERAAYAEARAKHDGLEREAKARAERLAAIDAERQQWGERAKRAAEQIAASDNARRRNPRGHCRACRPATNSGGQAPQADEYASARRRPSARLLLMPWPRARMRFAPLTRFCARPRNWLQHHARIMRASRPALKLRNNAMKNASAALPKPCNARLPRLLPMRALMSTRSRQRTH